MSSSIPSKAELEALEFPDDHLDDDCPVCDDGNYGHTFPDGTSSVVCTNCARQVKHRFPAITKIVGFDTENNPVNNPHIAHAGGHDFAIVADRYIVDPWLRDVCDEDTMVYDMHDEADRYAILDRYGDPTKWTYL